MKDQRSNEIAILHEELEFKPKINFAKENEILFTKKASLLILKKYLYFKSLEESSILNDEKKEISKKLSDIFIELIDKKVLISLQKNHSKK